MLNFVDELGPISAESHRIDFVHKRILCGVFLCDESSRVFGSGYAHPGTGPLDTRIALDGVDILFFVDIYLYSILPHGDATNLGSLFPGSVSSEYSGISDIYLHADRSTGMVIRMEQLLDAGIFKTVRCVGKCMPFIACRIRCFCRFLAE
jgi:hypothetical protein